MAFFTGLLEGFQERKQSVEAENRRAAEMAAQREAGVYEALLRSDRPDIQALAVTGLLESAQPRKKKGGMRGWLGEFDSSSIMPSVQALINAPTVEQKSTIPSRSLQPAAHAGIQPAAIQPQITQPPPPTGGAAMPAGNMVEAGPPQAPPQPMSWQQQGSQPYQMVGPPKPIFLTPEQRLVENMKTEARMPIERWQQAYNAFRQTMPDAEARAKADQFLPNAAGRAGQTFAEGEIVADPSSPTGYSQTLYLRSDPTQRQKIPAPAPTARSSRAVNSVEQIAFSLHGRPGEDPRAVMSRLSPAEMNGVVQEHQRQQAEAAAEKTTATGLAEANAPLTQAQKFDKTRQLRQEWDEVSLVPNQLRTRYQTMLGALEQVESGKVPAAAEAIIVAFQKGLDPTSVVMPGEFLRTTGTQSLWDRLVAAKERFVQGGVGVPKEELAQYVEMMKIITESYDTWLAIKRGALSEQARTNQLPESQIFGATTLGTPSSVVPSPPQSGGASPPPAPTTASPVGGAPATGGGRRFVKDANGAWVLPPP